MGKLIQGKWFDIGYDTRSNQGQFVREDAGFRGWIENKRQAKYTAESGRYHLYVSYACPWAHRTLVFMKLKGLDEHISVTVVSPDMLSEGWTMCTPEPLYGYTHLHQIYTHAKPDYTGRVTVPVLWDKQTQTIVSNESSEIIRMFNTEFNHITGNDDDYYPADLKEKIDEWNNYIYPNINNGVYRCGIATTQEAYEEAFDNLFDALDTIEAHLSTHRYLVGERLTEADWRLFVTLVRFDAVYVGHFKCNKKRISDYPNLQGYLKELYQLKDIADVTDFFHIKRHYYFSHTMINPSQIIPAGPDLELIGPHGRELI
ncbi:glutathione S-transferase family protein [Vibrio superstes]|uniref:Glutathione-dependent reductase n=1 Tax=Vibrio superstes NBRC 103154 TaxID=1219062 RepID=A0A511QNV5_9VIBR|nr:glutathione S-transferase family protein [Vibrio superstes]GEM79021.1 glutathione-dependent reductase [Vibrio superstes NBRC 103154]